MIIKEKSIKNYKNLENAIRYILSKEANDGFVHTRFILGDRKYKQELSTLTNDNQAYSIVAERRLQNMLQQYKSNDVKRIHKRHNETKFHHSIISFHKDDRLSQEELLKTVKRFIKERYPKSLVCAVSHHDKLHQHIHVVGSHVQVSGITNYHTKKQFSEIKQHMELWQEQHLNINYSNIQHVKKKEQTLVKDAEYQINLRGQQNEKQQFQMILAKAYSKAKSQKQFYALLKAEGLQLYYRAKTPGIIGEKRNYRLKTLGYSLERIALLELENTQKQKQLTRLAQLYKKANEQDLDLEQEF